MAATLRVADRWFVRKAFDDGVTLLYEPHVHALLRCNIWHIKGRDHDLVVDTGVGVASVRDELVDLIDKPVIAVATHYHYDHVGSLHEFDERVIHRLEAHRMNPYEESGTIVTSQFSPGALAYLEEIGYGISGEYLIDALPCDGYDPTAHKIVSTTATREVDVGDVIDLGDRHFEVLHLPGHSPGSIGLWESTTSTLFSGDAIYDGPLIDSMSDSNVADYRATMERLKAVPANVVHGGHDPSFGRERLVELADAYLAATE